MIESVRRYVIPQALDLLPAAMRSQSAVAMLIAIGLQETRFLERRQRQADVPALSFWQFERGESSGFAGVFRHPSTRTIARDVARRLCYTTTDLEQLRRASEHNDVLACAIARLLLWTLPEALPMQDNPAEGWAQYLAAWRPGDPKPQTWPAMFNEGWGRSLPLE